MAKTSLAPSQRALPRTTPLGGSQGQCNGHKETLPRHRGQEAPLDSQSPSSLNPIRKGCPFHHVFNIQNKETKSDIKQQPRGSQGNMSINPRVKTSLSNALISLH